ncbi:PEP-CTERM sorting domain-containing protein [Pseudoduganella dura]|uniref:PEP-CTERM sorting domain-containing protein n=1 Tax=Pseudoduganella dura TaxID=321982 RepID=UPI001E3F4D61|nr:PEP-CTERM sorting domain-containing protein [Pseudoduganella dura]
MKKTLYFLAGLAMAGAAQAERYTIHYTTSIQTIENSESPTGSFSSATAGDHVISLGDTVTGRFTFDTESQVLQYSDQAATGLAEYGYDQATTSVVQFDKSGYSQASSPGISTVWVFDRKVSTYGNDSVSFNAPTWLDHPGYISVVDLSFVAPFDTLNGLAVPTTGLYGMNGWFQYSYSYFTDEGQTNFIFRGALTSMSLVSAVPEPGTYAMLLAGIGLVAWRRRVLG